MNMNFLWLFICLIRLVFYCIVWCEVKVNVFMWFVIEVVIEVFVM